MEAGLGGVNLVRVALHVGRRLRRGSELVMEQCGTIPSLDGILEVLDGINTLENNAVIPKNAVGNDTKIQELPSTTCPLYLIHLHHHVCYT